MECLLGSVEPLVKLDGKQKGLYHVYEVVAETVSYVKPQDDRQGNATVYVNHQFQLVDEGKLLEGKKAGKRPEYRLVCDGAVSPGSGTTDPVNSLADSVSADGSQFTRS